MVVVIRFISFLLFILYFDRSLHDRIKYPSSARKFKLLTA